MNRLSDMCFAKRDGYLSSHEKLFDFINFSSVFRAVGSYIWNNGYRLLRYRQFYIALFKIQFPLRKLNQFF